MKCSGLFLTCRDGKVLLWVHRAVETHRKNFPFHTRGGPPMANFFLPLMHAYAARVISLIRLYNMNFLAWRVKSIRN